MNMILHGIEAPNVIHINTLSENLADIQEKDRYDLVMANPLSAAKSARRYSRTFPSGQPKLLPFPAALHQDSEGRRPCGDRDQEYFSLQHRQRFSEPPKVAFGKLQPLRGARLS